MMSGQDDKTDGYNHRTGRLMLAILGDLADVERDLIRTRTAEGRQGARAAARPVPDPHPAAGGGSADTAAGRGDAARAGGELQR